MTEPHASRIDRMRRQFDEAMTRFLTRLETAGSSGEQPRSEGWNPAQIAWHVAKVNESFAALMAGSAPGPQPAPPGFVERPWPEVAAGVPRSLTARGAVVPPPDTTMAEGLSRLRASAEAIRGALASLTPERGGYVLRTSMTGEICVYQIGEWATAHVIRHNAQAKRVMGS
jgi:hypothetical protein